MDKIYFAHPVNTYNRPIELKALELIAKTFPSLEIVNPNAPLHEAAYKKEGMAYFAKMVRETSAMVILPFDDGSIGAGIAKEALESLVQGSPVFYFEPPSLSVRKLEGLSGFVILTIEQTRVRLKSGKEEYC